MIVEPLTGADIDGALDDLARLRIAVFRAFPYLYDGDLDYERHYMRSYRDNPRAVLVVARDGDRIVGAATGMPFADHADAQQIIGEMPQADATFYCAESVLLPAYRGRGIGHRFFDLREAQARRLGLNRAVFCAVQRAVDHPARPEDYAPLDPFWRKRGYAPVAGVQARFSWTDLGDDTETVKTLNFWGKDLSRDAPTGAIA